MQNPGSDILLGVTVSLPKPLKEYSEYSESLRKVKRAILTVPHVTLNRTPIFNKRAEGILEELLSSFKLRNLLRVLKDQEPVIVNIYISEKYLSYVRASITSEVMRYISRSLTRLIENLAKEDFLAKGMLEVLPWGNWEERVQRMVTVIESSPFVKPSLVRRVSEGISLMAFDILDESFLSFINAIRSRLYFISEAKSASPSPNTSI